jgi:hypothetical protein
MQTHHESIFTLLILFFSCGWVSPSRLELKKYETLKHEHDDMKKKLNAMSADNNRLKSNLSQFDGKDKQQRMKIDELSQQMAESLEKLRSANKEKVMKKKRIRFNWIIKLEMKIAGSLIDAKLLRVSFACRLHSQTYKRIWKRRSKFARPKSAPFN